MSKFVAVFVISFVVVAIVADEPCQEGCSIFDFHESYDIPPGNNCTSNDATVTATCRTYSDITVEVTCSEGTWSSNLTEPCATCSTGSFDDDVILKSPDQTSLSPDAVIPIDTLVLFACSESYHELTGPTHATCKGPNKWDGEEMPECIAMCNEREIENGNIVNRSPENDTATVTCSDGYELSGESNITCQMDGTWSSTPLCESGTIRFAAIYWVTFFAVTLAVSMSHQ